MIEVFLMCLALNVYFEARGEPLHGQVAVAEVTLRRAASSGKPVCQEVFTDAQFSWTASADDLKVLNKVAWADAEWAAKHAANAETNFSGGATHFHATYVKPKWARKLCRTVQIGQHIFYKECDGNSPPKG